MMLVFFILSVLFPCICTSQTFDTAKYKIIVKASQETNKYFTNDVVWRGADGGSSIDLENGKIVWLFSDSFICKDSSASRKKSIIVRNSIAIQNGYDLKTASLKYYWNTSQKKPKAFFHLSNKFWFWTGHGITIKDKLLIFLIKEHERKTGIGFEAFGWYAVLVSNPHDDPSQWNLKYIKGIETYGTIVGSAAILKDEKYLYAFGAVEPSTHEVYVLRWKLDELYMGNVSNLEWWINDRWTKRKSKNPSPKPIFIAATEYSVYYDSILKKYIQIQSFGFGEGKIGIRMSDSVQGEWTRPFMFYTPEYQNVKRPFMYSAKAHPELKADGIYITYNVNSFDLGELIENEAIYFPKFILTKILKKDEP